MKVWIVFGVEAAIMLSEEDIFHFVGVFSSKRKAQKFCKDHEKYTGGHFLFNHFEILEVEVDEDC